MSVANIKETLLQEVNILPSVYYEEEIDFIESDTRNNVAVGVGVVGGLEH